MQRGEHILRNELGRYFDLQEESIGPPARQSTLEYLAGRLRKVDLANSVPVWAFGSCHNVQQSAADVIKFHGESIGPLIATVP